MRRLALLPAFLPGAAHAHASERMVILTLPTDWYMAGAGAAVLLTALAGLMARRLPAFRGHKILERPIVVPRPLTSWAAALGVWALVAVGIWGTRDPLENLLPLAVWTVLWVGLTLACVAFGNLWRDVEPWTGPVRTIRRLIGWTGSAGLSRLGHWPAVIGYLAFAWFEIVSLSPADPFVLARAVAAYYLLILALAVAEGEEWLARGEFLTVYFGFISRIAPFWAEHGNGRVRVMAGLPGAQVVMSKALTPSAIAFVTLILASVSFDGLAETFWWLARLGINPLEFPGRSAVLEANSAALVLFWAMSAALILGAVRAGLPAGHGFRETAGPLMLAFLPIAAGYHVAHYLIALLTNGQYAIAALNDPFGRGWSLLGLPDHWVSFGFLSTRAGVQAIWTAQFATILGAHLLAVLVSFKLSERIEGGHTLRAHLPMTLLMVGYTVFGLWLLSSPTAG
ncbi:hypothetical protein DEA8626_03563 [Defluviimonas aquaemixtae]|uniref:Fenitrothion hydrolase n=1 Tax=Albidovulum aquaemixtae TaxID=1542388 RepID=A0A2R8BMD4_9RHOB|nr:hypothetical protein [Defluviimonas aquaemixtae]SPH24511.1 hypothetical protein DEA8626_03563 [Defluviimonas aquaemixtae]